MSDKIEAQGKTVDDAVNEALLRLGARRDEVDVTVLDKPKSGFLGLLGGRPAKVEVTRKRNSRRDQRRNQNNQPAHEFGDNSRSGRNRKGSRNKKGGSNAPKKEAPRAASVAEGTSSSKPKNQGSDERQGRRDNERSGRNRRPRQQKRGGQENPRNQNQSNANQQETGGNQDNSRQNQEQRPERQPRNRRPRNSRQGRPQRQAQQPGNTVAKSVPVQNEQAPREEQTPRGGGRQNRDNRNSRPQRSEPRGPRVHNTTPDEIIVTGISAGKYAKPLREVPSEELNNHLEEITTGLLVRAGFPSRCEVKDSEYQQVRVTTDDESAGMLIGRHGATIDSVEHLVERMISMAVGDRVKMNLDINNYRLRRHETLLQRVEEAVAQVRETGKTYHVEPLNARERRIVHLAVEEYEGLRTFTMDSHRGRHVIIALEIENKGEEGAIEETMTEEGTTEETMAPDGDTEVESIEVEIFEEERPQD